MSKPAKSHPKRSDERSRGCVRRGVALCLGPALITGLVWCAPPATHGAHRLLAQSGESAQSGVREDEETNRHTNRRTSRARDTENETFKPAEETRLSTSAFRTGLRKRGLTSLLDLHLTKFPPEGRLDTLLMRRDLKLSQHSDESLPRDLRRDALASANRLLEEAIREATNDRRRFEWMFDLSHSLIYEEAEPYYSSILYRGGNADDRLKLQALAARALNAAERLIETLRLEYARIDNLSLKEFERLERSGEVERLDRLMPRAAYLRAWANFYDALPRDDDDATRSNRLLKIVEYFESNKGLLETPHDQSNVQVQAYLLLGMTQRLLNDHAAARHLLARAITVAERVADSQVRASIRWAELLAYIETVRNDVEDGKFTGAMTALKRFDQFVETRCAGEFQYRFVAGMLARWMHLQRAAGFDNNPVARDRHIEQSWEAILSVRRRYPNQVAEINAMLFDGLDASRDVSMLDPVESAAVVAGLLQQAERDPDRAETLLERAAEVGRTFFERAPREAAPLVPEVMYNVAVARYRLREHGAAARLFLQLVKEHPRFPSGRRAADFAVELAYSFYDQREEEGDASQEVIDFYRDALETLLATYPEFDSARYWQFYYAQLLMRQEEFGQAATAFARVAEDHEQYLRGVFLRLTCLARVIGNIDPATEGIGSVNRKVDEFADVRRDFQILLEGKTAPQSANDKGDRLLRSLLARTKLLNAEVQLMPAVDAPERALEALEGFEQSFDDFPNLFGDLWRVRLVAYEHLGRIEDAATAIPAFIAADPAHAGPTLQELYEELVAEMTAAVRAVVLTPETGISMQKALLAELLADHLVAWSKKTERSMDAAQRRHLLVQQATAKLAAGKFDAARMIFETAGAQPKLPDDRNQSVSIPLEIGYAESLFQLQDFETALVKFNHLATRLPADGLPRAHALLRDLQCRTRLGQPPGGIIKTISQQQYLHATVGDSILTEAFDRLLRENQRRADGN